MKPVWSTAAHEALAEIIRDTAGLVFPEARRPEVEGAMRRVGAEHRLSDAELVARVRDDAAIRDALVAELTVGKTYFERDEAQVALLRNVLLPTLIAARPDGLPVRVWSAGCASGEEPYTVQMLCERIGKADRVRVLGTDISRPRLEHARRAVYPVWSLRASGDETKRRFFRPRGKSFELDPRIRDRVEFRYLNLAEDRFPSLASGVLAMDLILCRNVLIYFDPPTVLRVAGRLIESLSEEGWLILGAADPQIGELVDCEVVETAAGLAYRRPAAKTARRAAVSFDPPVAWEPPVLEAAEAAAEPAPEPAPAPAARAERTDADGAVRRAYGARDFAAVRAHAEEAPEDGLSREAWVAWVRALANEGCLDEAHRVVDRARALHPSSAELLYLRAVLLIQTGRVDDAAAAARQALYLDRGLVVAHLALADAEGRAGGVEAARRSLRNAAALLAQLPQAEPVAASDGEPAGRLAQLVRSNLALLGAA